MSEPTDEREHAQGIAAARTLGDLVAEHPAQQRPNRETWSADEECVQAGNANDVVLPDPGMTPWCALPQNTPAHP